MKIIKYNGSNLEYKIGFRVELDFERETGKKTGETKTFEENLRLLYLGTKEAARKQKVDFSMDFEAFVDWLDDNPGALSGFSDEELPEDDGQEKKS